jgi:hypothetical protein
MRSWTFGCDYKTGQTIAKTVPFYNQLILFHFFTKCIKNGTGGSILPGSVGGIAGGFIGGHQLMLEFMVFIHLMNSQFRF